MENKSIWGKILHIVITVLTAIATTLLIYYNMFIFSLKIVGYTIKIYPIIRNAHFCCRTTTPIQI